MIDITWFEVSRLFKLWCSLSPAMRDSRKPLFLSRFPGTDIVTQLGNIWSNDSYRVYLSRSAGAEFKLSGYSLREVGRELYANGHYVGSISLRKAQIQRHGCIYLHDKVIQKSCFISKVISYANYEYIKSYFRSCVDSALQSIRKDCDVVLYDMNCSLHYFYIDPYAGRTKKKMYTFLRLLLESKSNPALHLLPYFLQQIINKDNIRHLPYIDSKIKKLAVVSFMNPGWCHTVQRLSNFSSTTTVTKYVLFQ